MNIDYTNNDQLIEQYLFGELTGEALLAFEKRMADDTAFAAAVQLEKNLLAGFEALGNQDLKAKLEVIHQEEIAQQPRATIRNLRTPLPWAIAAVLLFLIGFFIWNWTTTTTPEQLFAQNYAPPTFDTNRGIDAEQLQKIGQLYRSEDYHNFTNQYQLYLQNHPATAKDTLYLGIAAMELHQIDIAKNHFQTLFNNQRLEDDAVWYSALLAIREKELTVAMDWLKKITTGDIAATPARKEKAEKLLETLQQ